MTVIAKVESETRPGQVYEIHRTPQGNLTCSCPGFRFSRTMPKSCKHLANFELPVDQRIPLKLADEVAAEVVAVMLPVVERVQVAGSLRRRRPEVKDVDLVCEPRSMEDLEATLTAAGAADVHVAPVTVTFRWRDVQVEVYLADAASYAMTLLWRTGSRQHNIKLAEAAKKMGLSIRKEGVVDAVTEERLAWRSEQEIFAALKVPYCKPEERE